MTIKKECSDTTKTCMDAPKHHRAGVPARKVLARLIWRECVIYAYYLAMYITCWPRVLGRAGLCGWLGLKCYWPGGVGWGEGGWGLCFISFLRKTLKCIFFLYLRIIVFSDAFFPEKKPPEVLPTGLAQGCCLS